MNNKYLAWAGTLFLVIGSVTLLAYTNHLSNTAATTNTVSFSGEGKVVSKPDIALVSFAIVTEAATSKAAQDQNSGKSKTIVDFIKRQGVDDKDIKTTGYNIYPQYSYPWPVPMGAEPQSYPQYYNSNPKITGYQVNQSFEVKIRDLDKVSAILDGLVTAGANQVNNLGFQVDKPEKLKAEARQKAIADARMKARELENQLGIRLGKIVNFSENTGGYPGPYYMKGMAEGMGGGGEGPSVPSGENEITVNVSITYQIK